MALASSNSHEESAGGGAPPTLERRLALVLNGGISLAVWMGGVAYELDNLRRASNALAPPAVREGNTADAAERRLHELWMAAAANANQRFTIDVIGGTSAGGLNGVFLATAIARGARLDGLRKLWLTDGQLGPEALLTPQRPRAGSVLNGDFFLNAIGDALAAIGPASHPDAREVTLVTTASAAGGPPRTVTDSFGGAFTQPDHRRRYRFRNAHATLTYDPTRPDALFVRGTNREEFASADATAIAALARAGRATASVPVAFAPVEETQALAARRVWPPWPVAPINGASSEWLLDGGLLDNSPFTPVLDLIAKQNVASIWQRTICFVVPSGTELDPEGGLPASDLNAPPPWYQVAQHSVGLPGEGNFRDDIESLSALIRQGRATLDIARFADLLGDVPGPLEGADGIAATAERLLPYYRSSRAVAGVLEAIDTMRSTTSDGRLAPTLVVDPHPVVEAAHGWLPDSLPSESASLSEPWRWGLAVADRLMRLLLRTVRDRAEVDDEVRSGISHGLHRLGAVRKAVEASLAAEDGSLMYGPQDGPAVASILDRIYGALLVSATVGTLVREAAELFARGMGGDVTPIRAVRAALSLEIIDGAPGLPVTSRPSPIFDFARFGIGGIPTLLGGTGEAEEGSGDILYGSRLGHFAAFGTPEWRAWDWMWGRLHGAMHAAQLIGMTGDALDEIIEQIVIAEGTSPALVQQGIAAMPSAATDQALLRDLQSQGTAGVAVDALVDLLASPGPTNPSIAAHVLHVGGILGAVTARTRAGPRHPFVRFVTAPLRGWMWRRINR